MSGPRPEVPSSSRALMRKSRSIPNANMVQTRQLPAGRRSTIPYGASVRNSRRKLEYDLYYAKNYTPFLDLRDPAANVRVILWPEGAR